MSAESVRAHDRELELERQLTQAKAAHKTYAAALEVERRLVSRLTQIIVDIAAKGRI